MLLFFFQYWSCIQLLFTPFPSWQSIQECALCFFCHSWYCIVFLINVDVFPFIWNTISLGWYFFLVFNLQVITCFRVRINISWIRKYNAFFVFHDTVFPTYPENYNTSEGFCFLNRGIATKIFVTVKLKNDLNMMRISFLLKQLCCCCLDVRFFSLIIIAISFLIHFSYMLFFFHCFDILRMFYNYLMLL